MIANDWQLFYFRLFKAALDELEQAVTKLAALDPAGYKSHPKTRLLAQKLKSLGFERGLVITDEIDQNLALSSRNLGDVEVIAARQTNPVALVRHGSVLMTKQAVAKLEEMFK